TFTVSASVLPIAFVSGLMGPFVAPMPIGASIAFTLSVFVALTVTPSLGDIFLSDNWIPGKADKVDKPSEETRTYRVYNKLERPVIVNTKKRWLFLGGIFLLLMSTMVLFFIISVAVKMLPFDNKNEFQVVIAMPEGTTLERTGVVTQEISQYLSTR